MKKKRAALGDSETEFNETAIVVASMIAAQHRREQLVSYISFALATAIVSLIGTLVSLGSVSSLFAILPKIPQDYAILIGVVISCVVGISLAFLSVRIIYRKRKSENEKVFQRVRSKEKAFFAMLDLDFGSIIRRRELDA